MSGIDLEKIKGVDLEQIEKDKADLEALKSENNERNKQKLIDEKNWEKLEQQQRDQHQAFLDGLAEKHQKEIQSLATQIQEIGQKSSEEKGKMLNSLKSTLKDRELTAELARAKGNIPVLMPHIARFIDVRESDSGEYVAMVVDKDNNTRFNLAGKPMTISELVNEFKEKPEFAGDGIFEKEKKAGGSGSAGNLGDEWSQKNPFAKETENLTEQAMMKRKDPELYNRLKAAAGSEDK